MFDLIKRNWQKVKLEVNMFHHGLKCFLWFVLVACQKQEDSLLVEVVFVVLDFLLRAVSMELFELLFFIFIVFNLSVEVKPGAFLIKGGFLLLLFVKNNLLLGKNL